jgi:hypothetical protein
MHGTSSRAASMIEAGGLRAGEWITNDLGWAEHFAARAAGADGSPYGAIVEVEPPQHLGYIGGTGIDAATPGCPSWRLLRPLPATVRLIELDEPTAAEIDWHAEVRESRRVGYRAELQHDPRDLRSRPR